MGAILIAGGCALLALFASSGERSSTPDPTAGATTTPAKGKRPARRMSPAEAFDAGKKARDAEFKVESDAKAAREREIDLAVAKRLKSVAPASAPAPKSDPPAGDE